MVTLPTYQQQTTFSGGNRATYIPPASTAVWDQIGAKALNYAAMIAKDEGEREGIQQQIANPGVYQEPSILDRLTVRGQAKISAQEKTFATQKSTEWLNTTAGLEQQYRADPTVFKAAYESQRTKFMETVPPQLAAPFALHLDQQLVRSSNILAEQKRSLDNDKSLSDYVTNFETLKTNAYNTIVSGGDPERVREAMQLMASLTEGGIQQGYLKPTHAQKDLKEFGITMRMADLEKGFRSQPSVEAKKMYIEQLRTANLNEIGLNGIPLEPDMRLRMVHRLDAELSGDLRKVAEAQRLEQSSVLRSFNDEVAARTSTGQGIGLTEDRVRRAFSDDPLRAEEMVGKMRGATNFYSTLQKTTFTSMGEDQALLASLKPSGVGFADQQQYY